MKKEICANCGHKKITHNSLLWCPSDDGEDWDEDKKFTPQNQSPQTKPDRVYTSNSESVVDSNIMDDSSPSEWDNAEDTRPKEKVGGARTKSPADTIEKKIEEVYVFEDGKTYMIAVDTDDKKIIEKVIVELNRANPRIKWVVVPKGVVVPLPNQEAQKILRKKKKRFCRRLKNKEVYGV